ncbi:hypothetical protein [Poseidonibacter ostreae]|jgi:hypothetical protein|uniref:Uncharacterized protein n=1 Tax=Poseidonibacter ostreae TaxID=2654171 RepID=A0A6L4WU35_9BACT|nr:hypothetical protein [Poseidonibacter ostreae]KAB7888280.1 hypothetical protein GA417_00425 [Poseidonibacter ostreae]KAB7889164.1 hypothetical protein GBG18_11625 [Poseidonibacter ostreae]KAB7889586.1 hypothetical protein GBG19_05890 [Poseidonibacter ostreae]MAC83856.1 hypothetical protein [Arcobacter sp.]|tara:strand:+ start:3255 stop:4001 length:747 start_codon:yes stop_codon:yes gene_type:complete
MQYFGTIETKYEEIFITSSYMYFGDEDEVITPKELKAKIKSAKERKKNIIGTVFLYNPVVTPVGYDSNNYLLDQDFDSFGDMVELKTETYITIFKQAMREHCAGKIVEIRNLFNLNEQNIDASTLLMKFNDDLEIYNSAQNTEFEREIMYLDAANLIPSGKFVFFAWGDKISSKEFPYINDYARTIYENAVKLGKKVAFVYKREKTEHGAIEYFQFSNPLQNHKAKRTITNAIKKSFEQFPPVITSYE